MRTEILLRDLYRKDLNRDLALRLQSYSVEISFRNLVQIALQKDVTQQFLWRPCQGDLAHDLLQRSLQRELAESNRFLSYREHLQ